jgi:hypothetical protein
MPTTHGTTGRESPRTIRLAIAERGHRHHNIWYVWSYKLRRSCVLPSDAALFHWALLEADATVTSYQLEAPSLVTSIRGEDVGTRFDAEVKFVDGTVTWDEVKWDIAGHDAARNLQLQAQSQLAAQYGIRYRLFTMDDLRPHTNRVWNCLRMLQTLHAAEAFSVASARTCIVSRLLSGPAVIGELRSLDKGDEGLNLAAIFGLLLESAITGDIDSAPMTDQTTFWRKEH